MGAGEDIAVSFRQTVTGERRLFAAGVVALLGYGLWVTATGAALVYVADVVGLSLVPSPWTGGKTAVVAVALLAWVVGPSVLGVRLLEGQVTNANGNLARRYRYEYPAALLAAPLAVLAVAVGALALAPGTWLVYPLAVFGALFLLVRTLAYSYRVFALSMPPVMRAVALVTAPLLAVSLLTGGAVAAGREPHLRAVASGAGGVVGLPDLGAVLTGSVAAGGLSVPTVVVATVTVPVLLSLAYVAVQTAGAVSARVREPTVRRSVLRTGQRYPAFARPAAGREEPSADRSGPAGETAVAGGSDRGPATPAGSGREAAGTDDASGDEPADAGTASDDSHDPDGSPAGHDGEAEGETPATASVSNTNVYTPPDDFDLESPAASAADGDDSEGDGGTCPACGTDHGAEAAFCPACGEPL